MDRIKEAVTVLNEGGIVIFPTDTAFGIGCRIDYPETITRLFTIRKRPQTQAMSILVNSVEMAQKYLLPLPQNVRQVMETYWPGALTIVYFAHSHTPLAVRGGGSTVGVRMPNHETTLALIEAAGVPLLGPSANFHSEATPYEYSQLDPLLVKQVDFVLRGECRVKEPSTVIDCTLEHWKIIRQGSVKFKSTLVIDTTNSLQTIVRLTHLGQVYELSDATGADKSQNVLTLIEKALEYAEITFPQLTTLEVNEGPGSFTGVRVGVSVANILGWSLSIPVNGKSLALPKYSPSKFDAAR
jgi:L-threonylcarbamoyladenylate synthase